MASRLRGGAETGLAAKLWAAARNTVNMLTNEDDDDTAFSPIENMLDKSPGKGETETMDVGLKIDSVFTLPLDMYLKQQEEQPMSRPIEQILKVEQQTKVQTALCKPCSVVLEKIDHDLAGRHRVFYRQWKRRFDKCGYSCRQKFIDTKLRSQSKAKTKTDINPNTSIKNVIKTGSISRSCFGNKQRSINGMVNAGQKANVSEVKHSSKKRNVMLRDFLHKKSFSTREKLRYQYLKQMSSTKTKDNSTKSNIMRDRYINTQSKTSSEQTSVLSSEDLGTTAEKQCTKDNGKKIKTEPGLELQNSSGGKPAGLENINVKVEPKDEHEYGNSMEKGHSHIPQDRSRRGIDVKVKTEPGLVSLEKNQQGSSQIKKMADLRGKHSTSQSSTETSKSKPKTFGELTTSAQKISTSFSPYMSKTSVSLNTADGSKNLKTSIATPDCLKVENRSNTVPFVQNSPIILANPSQVSGPQVQLQYVLTGVNATGNQTQPQLMLTGSNSASTLNAPRLVLTGLNSSLGSNNTTQMVLTAGTNTTGTQTPTQMILNNPNQLTTPTNQPQLVLTNANRQPTSQGSSLILANSTATGQPRLFLANASPKPPVTPTAPQLLLTNTNQAVPNQGQQQLVLANMYTNPNQPGLLQTGQLVLNQIVQQVQQQVQQPTNVLNISSTTQMQPQPITGAPVRNIVPTVQGSSVGQSTITRIQQPVPVIQTSKVLPSTMNFPPGTLFLNPNSLPEQAAQSGMQALAKVVTEKQKDAPTVVRMGPQSVDKTDSQSVSPLQGKTVTIGGQSYLLVPTSSKGPVYEEANEKIIPYGKLTLEKKMKLISERNEASRKIQETLRQTITSKLKPQEKIPDKLEPLKSKTDRPPAAASALIRGAKQNITTDSKLKSLLKNTTSTDDVILIDDPDAVPANTAETSLRKRNPRKSKPQPRLDYDEVLKKQQMSRLFPSSSDEYDSDSEVDIEAVESAPEIAGKGVLIPKNPTMPLGLGQWPDGATIGEKSITLPPSLLRDMNVPIVNNNNNLQISSNSNTNLPK